MESILAVAGQLLAIGLSVWARCSFQDGQFIVHAEPVGEAMLRMGPYQAIRHPMYAAALLMIWSSVLGHPSPVTATLGVIVTIVIAIRIVTEDQFLREHFAEYAQYARTTKRVIPFVI